MISLFQVFLNFDFVIFLGDFEDLLFWGFSKFLDLEFF